MPEYIYIYIYILPKSSVCMHESAAVCLPHASRPIAVFCCLLLPVCSCMLCVLFPFILSGFRVSGSGGRAWFRKVASRISGRCLDAPVLACYMDSRARGPPELSRGPKTLTRALKNIKAPLTPIGSCRDLHLASLISEWGACPCAFISSPSAMEQGPGRFPR